MMKINCRVGFNDIAIGAHQDTIRKAMQSHSIELPETDFSTGFIRDHYETLGVTLLFLDEYLHHISFKKPALILLHGIEISLGRSKKQDLVDCGLDFSGYCAHDWQLYSDDDKVIFNFKNKKHKSKIQGFELIGTTFDQFGESLSSVLDKWVRESVWKVV